jgi:hypothetical protein
MQAEITNPQLIDKKYVHKFKQENVHIYNLRRSLCRTISAEFFEKYMPSLLTQQEYNYISKFYFKQFQNCDYFEPIYILQDAINCISLKELENLQLSKQDFKYFNKCYLFKPDENKYVLREGITEIEEKWCLEKILKRAELQITDADTKKLAEILEKVEKLKKANSFIANIHVNPTQSYFFEHPLDHVPGMFILEACRQIGIACFHMYGNTPFQGVNFLLTDFNAKFQNYIELDFPIYAQISVENLKYHKKGYWSSLNLNIGVFQNGRESAKIKINGTCIEEKILKRIRTQQY